MLDDLLKAVVNTAVIPVKIVADVVTLGGALNNEDETYTVKQVKKVVKNLDDSTKDK